MDQPVELILPAPNEQDDSEIEELLSSFYFDNSDKRYSTRERSRHASVTVEHLNPIYEEEETLYDLYHAGQDDDDDDLHLSTTSGSSDSDDSSSSSSSIDISLQYGPKLLPSSSSPSSPTSDITPSPSDFWPIIEEDDDSNATITAFANKLSSSRSPSKITVEGEDDDDTDEGESEDEDNIEWERRGRSRAVPARLMRWAHKKGKGQIQRQRLDRENEQGTYVDNASTPSGR
ncbi:hypothetical protein GYMLUDRAFT_69920 [Collybiopsis luxurians FD-317 M1]|nr:hypothetical protein GYMLUDRAFT_69920 [Collybiopsis luxurians FD-317 M1]